MVTADDFRVVDAHSADQLSIERTDSFQKCSDDGGADDHNGDVSVELSPHLVVNRLADAESGNVQPRALDRLAFAAYTAKRWQGIDSDFLTYRRRR